MYPYCTTSGIAASRRTPPAPAHLLLALFHAPDGTDLSSYVMDIGPGFSVLGSATYTINSDSVSSSGGHNIAVSDAGQADIALSVKINYSVASDAPTAVVRAADNDNWWLAQISASALIFEIWDVSGGSFTLMAFAPAPAPDGLPHILGVRTKSDTITLSWDGSDTLSFSPMVTHLANTLCGLDGFNAATIFDDFVVDAN